MNLLNPLKADCYQNTGKKLILIFLFLKIIIISTATFAANISHLQ